MQRRNVLKALASTALGAGWMAFQGGRSWAAAPRAARAKPTATPFVPSRDGASLYHKDWGKGRPVLFVHSWANHSDLWQYQMIHLAERGLRCVAYDKRGHGRSSDPGRGYDFDTLADDLAAIVEKLDLRDVVLVGHSMGAGEIVRYLSRHGSGRVARVLLVAPTTPFLLKTPDNPDGFERAAFDRLRAKLCADFPKWLADNSPPFFVAETSPDLIRWGIQMSLAASLKAVIDTNRALTETDFRPELRQLKIPTLIVQGDHDRSAPLELTGRRTAQLIPGAELRVYEGAPHGLFLTHMERFNGELLAYATG